MAAVLSASDAGPLARGSSSPSANPGNVLSSDAAADEAADAEGSLFHTSQFIEQFIVQMLVPLSGIYLVLGYSWGAAANVFSVPRPFSIPVAMIFFTAQLISMAPIAVLVGWTLRSTLDNGNDVVTACLRADVIALAATMTMHRLAISIKYAFQPTAVYAQRMSKWTTFQERLDDQLFASWFKLTRETIEREVGAALRALDDEEAMAVHALTPDAFERLHASLHPDARADLDAVRADDGGGALPSAALVTALLVHVNEETSGYVLAMQRATSVAGLLSTFAMAILRSALGLPVAGSTPLDATIIISAWVSNFLLLPTVFTFLAVGIVDHLRRKLAFDALAQLYRPSSLHDRARGAAGMLVTAVRPPVLRLASIDDARAFLASRSLLLGFGASFHMRLVTVISADLIVLVFVAAFCIIGVFTTPTTSGVGALYAPVALHHALVLPGIALCALGLFMAARANVSVALTAGVVAKARLLMRVALHESGADSAETARTFSLFDDIERVLRENSVPITVLGIAATPALTNALAGAFASVETLIVSSLVSRAGAADSKAVPSPSAAPAAASPTAGATVSPSATPSPAAPPNVSDVPLSLGAAVGYFFAAVILAAVIAALVVAVSRRRASVTGSRLNAAPALAAAAGAVRTPALSAAAGVVSSHKNPLLAAAQRPAEDARAALPAGWERRSDDCDMWFVNTATGETRWTLPSS